MSYALKLAAAGILILLAGVVAVLIFDALWFRVSLGAAIVVVAGGLLVLAWYVDRKDRSKRAAIDELPRV